MRGQSEEKNDRQAPRQLSPEFAYPSYLSGVHRCTAKILLRQAQHARI
jgi:hypothetical protein